LGLGQEIMRYQADGDKMVFKQQLPFILIGLAWILLAVVALTFDTVLSNIASDATFRYIIVAGVVYVFFRVFSYIQAMELIVYENGFSYRIGEREDTAKYEDVLEMSYGEVTYQGKATENIRLCIVFNNNQQNLYLPHITKDKAGDWAAISECLVNAYAKYTGKNLTTGEHTSH